MSKKIVISLALMYLATGLSAQYSRGAVLDPALYNRVPRKAEQISRSYTALAPSASLKQYAPYPGNQGQYGTCVGWSSVYAARTIAESIALNRRDRFLTTANVFSPIFVYKSVYAKPPYNNPNPSGKDGLSIASALEFMKQEGAIKRPDFEKTAADFPKIQLSLFTTTQRYPIGDYAILYASYRGTVGGDERTRAVKKSLAEGKPVIIGMNCPDSFFTAKDIWHPAESPSINYGGHGMCVVGYDDAKYGGAFEIQNSWGEDWGNRGYIWIPYGVFNQFVAEAYEVIENLANYKDGAEYSGFVQIEVYRSNQGMPVRYADGYYQTLEGYASGTQFRYLLGNGKPAYVYAFAGDSGSRDTTRIFPPEGDNGETILPVLDYSENTVAFPGEYSWIRLDQKPGADYLAVLFAKEALDIDAIRSRFAGATGSFPERVAKTVGANYIPTNQSRYEPQEMRFTARSGNPKAVFGLLLAIDHR